MKALLAGWLGYHNVINSNLIMYLSAFHLQMSHGHDIRCAVLMTPMIPDELNFTAYHFVHHVSPSNNFGLTRLSDLIWDYVYGVSTIKSYKLCLKELLDKDTNRDALFVKGG